MSVDTFGRIDWETLWISLAYLVSQRSIDPNTKHGCVFVTPSNVVLSMGYNGPFSGINDEDVPLNRPEKYYWLKHAEENAILNAAKEGIRISNCICYISGPPCDRCMRGLVTVGCQKIVYGVCGSKCIDEQSQEQIDKMVQVSGLEIKQVNSIEPTIELFNQTLQYLNRKVSENER